MSRVRSRLWRLAIGFVAASVTLAALSVAGVIAVVTESVLRSLLGLAFLTIALRHVLRSLPRSPSATSAEPSSIAALRRLFWASYAFVALLALGKILNGFAVSLSSWWPWLFLLPAGLAATAAVPVVPATRRSAWVLASALGIAVMSLASIVFFLNTTHGALELVILGAFVIGSAVALVGLMMAWMRFGAREA